MDSRNRERAVASAARRAISYAHGSYEALATEPAVDIVYVATPHSRHAEDVLLCLAAGKHVLVEKPFTATGEEAERVAEAARKSGRFVMEAMWTRFFPLFSTVRKLIMSGRIGSVLELRADYGNVVPYDPRHRLWNPDLAGGALLDLGVYPLSWAVGLLGWRKRFRPTPRSLRTVWMRQPAFGSCMRAELSRCSTSRSAAAHPSASLWKEPTVV